MIMYIADLTGHPEINEVEVLDFTQTMVTLATGNRVRRVSKQRIYAETQEDAKKHLNHHYTQQVRVVRDRLAELEERLAIVRSW